ncbi:hypothetical protein IKT18_02445 [Candidatus Saccharibacteria bacterium]|nr:hypothetical protein [Candidatus Saccharibacteria bacterium]
MNGENLDSTVRITPWDSLAEAPKASIFEKWSRGLEHIKKAHDNPFEVDLQEFLDEKELRAATADKSPAEVAEIEAKNLEALQHNNEEFSKLDEKIIDISELPQEERDALYQAEDTPDSVRAIIACIDIINMPDTEMTDDDRTKLHHVMALEMAHYGLKIVSARKQLAESGAHFKILTKKEREAVEPGSLEDIASAALESFVMNPNYGPERIVEYDDYLNRIKLDCTKRRIVKEKGVRKVEGEVDLEEFQERATESMSEYLLDANSLSEEKLFTQSEFAAIQGRVAEFEAKKKSGHHFETNAERDGNRVQVINEKERRIERKGLNRRAEGFREEVAKRIQSANRAIFKYNKKIAKIEVKPWAEKIDLSHIEEINKDENLPYEEKCKRIVSYLQEVFDIHNKKRDGSSEPIGLKWFKYRKEGEESTSNEIKDEDGEDDGLPVKDRKTLGYYKDSEKSIFLPKQDETVRTLHPDTIGTIIHEMWHAKQYDLVQNAQQTRIPQDELKAHYYTMNKEAYITSGKTKKDWKKYYQQIMEIEAFTIDNIFTEHLKRTQNARSGRKVLQAFFHRQR